MEDKDYINQKNIPSRPNFKRPIINRIQEDNNVIQNNNVMINDKQSEYVNSKNEISVKKSKLNEQAKLVLISMFSAICFAGAIAYFILMFIL